MRPSGPESPSDSAAGAIPVQRGSGLGTFCSGWRADASY